VFGIARGTSRGQNADTPIRFSFGLPPRSRGSATLPRHARGHFTWPIRRHASTNLLPNLCFLCHLLFKSSLLSSVRGVSPRHADTFPCQVVRIAQPSIKRPMATIQLPATRTATRAHGTRTEAACPANSETTTKSAAATPAAKI
jgi:hypothetical protein